MVNLWAAGCGEAPAGACWACCAPCCLLAAAANHCGLRQLHACCLKSVQQGVWLSCGLWLFMHSKCSEHMPLARQERRAGNPSSWCLLCVSSARLLQAVPCGMHMLCWQAAPAQPRAAAAAAAACCQLYLCCMRLCMLPASLLHTPAPALPALAPCK